MLVNSSTERGCGKRKEGGLYACVPSVAGGEPLETFIIDHPMPWTEGPFRGCRFMKREDGVTDLIMWVGEQFYPFPSDFAEEGRVHGFSKRVPLSADADYGMLTSYQSRLILVHPKAVVDTPYQVRKGETVLTISPDIDRPMELSPHLCDHKDKRKKKDKPCTFATWDLSALRSCTGHEVFKDEDTGYAHITTPSVNYIVHLPKEDPVEYSPGIFLALPWSHFEYVSDKDTLPETVAGKLGNNMGVTAVTPE